MKIEILPQYIYVFDCPFPLKELAKVSRLFKTKSNFNNIGTENTYVLEDKRLSKLKAWIEEKLNDIIVEEGFKCKIAITQSWFNYSYKNQWHHRHTHSNSFWSGILVLTESNSSTWFSIENLWKKHENTLINFISGEAPANDKYLSNLEIIHKFKSSPGKLIIFPSTLTHSVDEHQYDYARISLSFNTFPYGKFGNHMSYSGLNLPKPLLNLKDS